MKRRAGPTPPAEPQSEAPAPPATASPEVAELATTTELVALAKAKLPAPDATASLPAQ